MTPSLQRSSGNVPGTKPCGLAENVDHVEIEGRNERTEIGRTAGVNMGRSLFRLQARSSPPALR
jgi:hypothetical protein